MCDARGEQRKDSSALGGVKGKSEVEQTFFHVKVTHRRGDSDIFSGLEVKV